MIETIFTTHLLNFWLTHWCKDTQTEKHGGHITYIICSSNFPMSAQWKTTEKILNNAPHIHRSHLCKDNRHTWIFTWWSSWSYHLLHLFIKFDHGREMKDDGDIFNNVSLNNLTQWLTHGQTWRSHITYFICSSNLTVAAEWKTTETFSTTRCSSIWLTPRLSCKMSPVTATTLAANDGCSVRSLSNNCKKDLVVK